MSSYSVYHQVRELLEQHFDEQVDENSRERITLLVLGIIRAKSASPARIAEAIKELGLSNATAESIERRIRRIENDPELSATLCFHPFAREHLAFGRPKELLLIAVLSTFRRNLPLLDPTTQDDRVVMVTVSI